MIHSREHDADPLVWTGFLCLCFLSLCFVRLTVASQPFFDEVHYLPAARALLDGSAWLNREHPILGKEIIALSIAVFGDTPLGWRLPSALFGTLALFSSMRALWFATEARFAVLAYGFLLATGFYLFVQSRIAMLDIFMVGFFMVALWQLSAATRQPETGRWRLAVAGVALGLAMASKWNVVPLAMVPGIAFFIARLSAGRRRLLTSQRGIPIPGISLAEAALWLGAVPLLFYFLPHMAAWFVAVDPLTPGGFIAYHSDIIALQESVKQPHPYQSVWWQWVLNLRAIWYLYLPIDAAQRGVMLIGNPATMLLGLPAMVWCAWTGTKRRDWARLGIVLLYGISLGMWLIANKPVQFIYHYFLPSMFLLAALAMALDDLSKAGRWWLAMTPLIVAGVVFAYFYPILSAAPLDGEMAFLRWAWGEGWR